MRTYAIVNRKGGVGKTTTAVNLAYVMATSLNHKVLLIDADSQGNATSTVCLDAHPVAGLDEVLHTGTAWYPDLIYPTGVPGVDILPSTEGLADYELRCTIGQDTPNFGRLRELVEAIAEDGSYDDIIIDCPPYYSVSCISALSACDSIIIPSDMDAYSATGVAELARQIDNIRRACPNVKVSGVLVTKFDRGAVAADAVDYLREECPVHVFRTKIRASVEKARGATWAGMPLGQWSPWCNAARDYREFVAELMGEEVQDG